MKAVTNLMVIFLLLTSYAVAAQCPPLSVAEINEALGLDALLISNQRVSVKAGTFRKPVRTRKTDVWLEANISYRFVLHQSRKQEAIMQLFHRRELIMTSDPRGEEESAYFEFVPEESAYYRMVFSSARGKAFCTSVSLAMVLSDSSTLYDSRLNPENREVLETLYIGVDNPIKVAATGIPGGSLEVTTSEGHLAGERGQYTLRVYRPGIIYLNVRTYRKDGKFHEEKRTPFRVAEQPVPSVRLSKYNQQNFSTRELKQLTSVFLQNDAETERTPFALVSFRIASTPEGIDGIRSLSQRLTGRQQKYLAGLPPGSVFYLTDIKFRLENGKVITVTEPVRYTVE